jgi:hypothetical protein
MLIPSETAELKAVLENVKITTYPREYLGVSQIGHSCARYLWYYFRWCFKGAVTIRQQRIFDRGHMEEERVIEDLKKQGILVYSREKGLADVFEHYRGHIDGIVDGFPGHPNTPHILEIKGLKAATFRKIQKHGLEQAVFTYWAQVQEYMRLTGIKRTLFIITNKDTEEREYLIVKFDKEKSEIFSEKAESIITEETQLPFRIGPSTYFECKWCDAQEICHKNAKIEITCRTCLSAELNEEGQWKCLYKEIFLDEKAQRAACPEYSKMTLLEEDNA